jgi:hypothetical protein
LPSPENFPRDAPSTLRLGLVQRSRDDQLVAAVVDDLDRDLPALPGGSIRAIKASPRSRSALMSHERAGSKLGS